MVTFFGAGRHLQIKYGLANLKFAAIFDRHSSLECIAVRKDWPELAALLDKALLGIDPVDMLALQRKWNSDEAECMNHAGCVPGEYSLLTVSDDGSGMEQQTINRIFEPFFTTKALGLGTGLGLSTVYGIVKQNNGFIDVNSEPGKGTSFTIYLPSYQGRAEPIYAPDEAEPLRKGHETILLVEDQPAILKVTRIMLERLGYSVLSASGPSQAVRLAEMHGGSIDLLITDVIMPEMNGRDLARKLLSVRPKVRQLFMSGYTANVIVHRGVLAAGVHFIQKPFSINDLAKKVRAILDG